MGLGPHRKSLLKRLGQSSEPITLEALVLDRALRDRTRRLARVHYAMKHKAKVKPLAPVEYAYTIAQAHWWRWIGEKPLTFEMRGATITLQDIHSSDMLKAAGFKLPKLPPKKERKYV